MLTHDPSELLSEYLDSSSREPDGLLHPSGDLVGSLRHTQLRAAGAPTRELPEAAITNLVRLQTGTLWHSLFEGILRNRHIPVMTEVALSPYLPEGWAGTADWILWSDEYKAFVLGDLKTIKGEGMPFIRKDGIKEAHMWQLSAYWYALAAMGLPLVKAFVVLYLPMNETYEGAKPELVEGKPLDRDLVMGVMSDRWAATQKYLAEVKRKRELNMNTASANAQGLAPEWFYVNDHLAPVQEREMVVRWDKARSIWDVKLVPSWSTAYCPYPAELCDCHTQGQTKIGHWEWDAEHNAALYVARKGYEEHTPQAATEANLSKKQWTQLKEAYADRNDGPLDE